MRASLTALAFVLLLAASVGVRGATVETRIATFSVGEVVVAPGESVRWVNADGRGHTVTSSWDDGATFHFPLLPGESAEWVFETLGEFTIHCVPHAEKQADGSYTGMVMRVHVQSVDAQPTLEPARSSLVWFALIPVGLAVVATIAVIGRRRR